MALNRIYRMCSSAWYEFVYGGHILSVGGASIAYTTGLIIGVSITWELLLIVYLALQAIYLYDRYTDIKRDTLISTERALYLSRRIRRIQFTIGVCVSLLVIFLVASGNLRAISFGFVLIGGGFLYNIRLKRLTTRIVAFKNLFVSLYWASITLFVALYYLYPVDTAVLLIFSFVFIILFVNVSFCDIKDCEDDRERGLLTPVVVLGQKRLLRFARIVVFVSVAPLVYGVIAGFLPTFSLFLLFIVPYALSYFRRAEKKDTDLGHLTNTVVYGGYILWSVFAYVGRTLL